MNGTSKNSSFTLTPPSPLKGEGGKDTRIIQFPRPWRERARVRGLLGAIIKDDLKLGLLAQKGSAR
jgi:hypothetical protein